MEAAPTVDVYAERGSEGPYLVEREVDPEEARVIEADLSPFGWRITTKPSSEKNLAKPMSVVLKCPS